LGRISCTLEASDWPSPESVTNYWAPFHRGGCGGRHVHRGPPQETLLLQLHVMRCEFSGVVASPAAVTVLMAGVVPSRACRPLLPPQGSGAVLWARMGRSLCTRFFQNPTAGAVKRRIQLLPFSPPPKGYHE
jgi:hypothetical protein